MKNLTELYSKLKMTPITLIAARVGDNFPSLLADLILHLGLKDDQHITIYTTEDAVWLQTHILAHLNHSSSYAMEKYLNPCIYKYCNSTIDEEKLREDLQTLRSSYIAIESLARTSDYIDYIFENEASHPSDIIIIYHMEDLFEEGKHSPKEIMEVLKRIKGNSSLILTGYINKTAIDKKEFDFEDIRFYREMEPYLDETVLFYSKNPISEDPNRRIIINTSSVSFEVDYNRETDQFI